VFAVLGLQLFSRVPPGLFLNEEFINFHSFASSMQLMFIFNTNERWSDAMYDCMVQPPRCSAENGNCGQPILAPLYFVAFLVVSAFVVSNLFIAIILDNFATTMRMDASDVTMSDLHRYTEIWSQYDPDATLLMPTDKLPDLLSDLRPPLGLARKSSRLELLLLLSRYGIPERSGSLHFVEVLIPLARAVDDLEMSEREIRKQNGTIVAAFPELLLLPTLRYDEHPVTVGHYFASTYMAAAFRRRSAGRVVQLKREELQAEADKFLGEARRQPAIALNANDIQVDDM
jgi:hypothetical protein